MKPEGAGIEGRRGEDTAPPGQLIGTTGGTISRALRAGAIAAVAQLVAGLVAYPVIVHHVGASLFGAWSAITSILAVGTLADSGVRQEITRRVGSALGSGRRDELRHELRLGVGILALAATVVLVLGVVIAPAVVSFAFPGGVPGYGSDVLATVLRATFLLICVGLVVDGHLAALRGIQRSDIETLATVTAIAPGIALTVGLAIAGFGLWALFLGAVANALTRWTLQWITLARLMPGLGFGISWPTGAAARAYLGFSGLLLLTQVSDVVDSQWDKVVLARFVGPASVAFFTLGTLLVLQVKAALVLPLAPILAAVSELHRRNRVALERIFSLLSKASAVLFSVLLTGIFVLGPAFVRLWLGPGFDKAGLAARLFAVAVGLNLLYAAASYRAIGMGWHRVVGYSALANIVVNGGVSFGLAATIGFNGPLIGSLVGNGCGFLVFQGLLWRRTRERWTFPQMPAVLTSVVIAFVTIVLGLDRQTAWAGLFACAIGLAAALAVAASLSEGLSPRMLRELRQGDQQPESEQARALWLDRLRAHLERRGPGWRILDVAARVRDRTANLVERDRRQRLDLIRAVPGNWDAEVAFLQVEARPTISVVIPVFDNWHLTERCLRSLHGSALLDEIEVIVVDDHSRDDTAARLGSVRGVRILTNEANLGFTISSNRGAREARGQYVFLLNNDCIVLSGCLEGLLAAMQDPTVGVAGAKLVYPTGRLQEAGGIIWSDGTGWNVGRGRSPLRPEYNFRRDVDYCSAAALMVRADLLHSLGFFDERYAPAYYEDTDLCFAARARGFRVVYEPMAVVVHDEGMTHGTDSRAGLEGAHGKSHQEINRHRFVAKWSAELVERLPPPPRYSLRAELRGSRRSASPSVLICDWTVPTPDRDSGSQRMDWMLRLLAPMCSRVTFVPSLPSAFAEYVAPYRERGIEMITGSRIAFGRLMRQRPDLYDLVILSRPTVGGPRMRAVRRHQRRATVIFDTVDLKSLRLEREVEATGSAREGSPKKQRDLEGRIVARSDLTATVSDEEARHVEARWPGCQTVVLPNVHHVPDAAVAGFESRWGLLFIGSFVHGPNIDAVLWFATKVLPLIRRHIDVTLRVVGQEASDSSVIAWGPHVRYEGWVPDVTPLFNGARVSVAPLLYGAGMKGKIGQAMASGLPVVTTTVGAEGMDLTDGVDVLIRDTAEGFADAVVELHRDAALWTSMSNAARELVVDRWGPDAMRGRLERLLQETADLKPR